MYDILIRNCMILDGTGADRYAGEIAVSAGKIVALAAAVEGESKNIIDAEGACVSPGFIDGHSHNDGYLFHDPSGISKLSQGCTTEISGNCGEGLAPVSDRYYRAIHDYYKPYYPPAEFREFRSFASYFSRLDRMKLGINVGYYAAHGTIRMSVMGFENRFASPGELALMKERLREGLEAGCLGMSSGLVYAPGNYSDTSELVELCKLVREYNGVYTTHIRNEGYDVIASVGEAIEIARRSGVRTVISHLKVNNKDLWGYSEKLLDMIDAANRDGCDIYFDQYPYPFSCQVLYSIFPVECMEGGVSSLITRLRQPEYRRKLRDRFLSEEGGWDNPIRNFSYAGIHLLTAENRPEAEGKTLEQYASEIGQDPIEAMFDLVIDSGGAAYGAYDCMSDKDIERIMRHPRGMVGSDGIAVFPHEMTHPRLYGTFPRVLGRYVREKKILTLEEAVRKMTSSPASVIGLKGKGLLATGYDADITIFDHTRILDTATLAQPQSQPEGIHTVIVGGRVAIQNGTYIESNGKRILLRERGM